MCLVLIRYVVITVMLVILSVTARADDLIRASCFSGWDSQTRARWSSDVDYAKRAWDAGSTYRQLVVLVSFDDCDFSWEDPQATYHEMFNTPGYNLRDGKGCVADYFCDQSNGLLNLAFDVYGPYKTHSKVKTGSSDGNDGHGAFREATRMLMDEHPEIDFSVYDWNGDGYVEQVVYVYAGYSGNQSTIKDEGYIWPSTGSFSSISTKDGYQISHYSASGELWVNNSSCGIGLICHEFSHCFGLPDVYPTSARVSDFSIVDEWDVMDGGTATNYGWCPPNYSPLEKMIMGWLTPTELTTDTTITDIKTIAEGGEVYMIRHTDDEFFLLENRQWNGWDYGLPGYGLVVYHVNFISDLWQSNVVNNVQGKPNYSLVAADERTYTDWFDEILASEVKNPYVDTKRRLNSRILSTAPYPWQQDDNCVDEVTLFDDKSLCDITQHEDGTVSFTFHASGSDISHVKNETKAAGVYTLSGVKVSDDGQTEGLPKGVYIVNGCKIIH